MIDKKTIPPIDDVIGLAVDRRRLDREPLDMDFCHVNEEVFYALKDEVAMLREAVAELSPHYRERLFSELAKRKGEVVEAEAALAKWDSEQLRRGKWDSEHGLQNPKQSDEKVVRFHPKETTDLPF